MSSFIPSWDSLNYLSRQYTRFIQSSIAVSEQTMQAYNLAWSELMQDPKKLIQRNLNFVQEVMTPPVPSWQTPYRELEVPKHIGMLIKLLDFTQPDVDSDNIVPTLVLPPQAGHHSYIADYSPEQSQVQTLRKNGLGKVYCIEWKSANNLTRHAGIEEFIETVRYSVEKIGGKANLVGDCQGGWLAAIFAAMYPKMVNTLTVAGAPIDFQAGNGQIKQTVNYVAKNYPDNGMAFYRGLVAMGNGVLDGQFLIMGFNIMRPQQLPERFINLYTQIHDPQALARFRQMKNWYDYTQNVSGTFYLWLVEHLFRDNELVLDKLVVGGRTLSLKDYTGPLFLMGGRRDHITPPVQVFNMEHYVGTPKEHIHKYMVSAGHIGLFMGKEVLHNTWSRVTQKITEYSQLYPREVELEEEAS